MAFTHINVRSAQLVARPWHGKVYQHRFPPFKIYQLFWSCLIPRFTKIDSIKTVWEISTNQPNLLYHSLFPESNLIVHGTTKATNSFGIVKHYTKIIGFFNTNSKFQHWVQNRTKALDNISKFALMESFENDPPQVSI